MTYDELVSALEDAWLAAGLHEHVIEEQFLIERQERSFHAEIFADHDEPLPEPPPPWVEVTFRWGPGQYLRGEGLDGGRANVELTWTYHVELSAHQERSDVELARAFHGAVRAAFRRVDPGEPPPNDYLDIEVRRTYQPEGEGLVPAWIELVGSGMTDLSDLWVERDQRMLHEIIGEELHLVAAVLHALHDVFAPGGGSRGSYRTVETA